MQAGNNTYFYNLTGKNNTAIDTTYRNADGSINMGILLKIKEQTKLFGDDVLHYLVLHILIIHIHMLK